MPVPENPAPMRCALVRIRPQELGLPAHRLVQDGVPDLEVREEPTSRRAVRTAERRAAGTDCKESRNSKSPMPLAASVLIGPVLICSSIGFFASLQLKQQIKWSTKF